MGCRTGERRGTWMLPAQIRKIGCVDLLVMIAILYAFFDDPSLLKKCILLIGPAYKEKYQLVYWLGDLEDGAAARNCVEELMYYLPGTTIPKYVLLLAEDEKDERRQWVAICSGIVPTSKIPISAMDLDACIFGLGCNRDEEGQSPNSSSESERI